MPEGAFSSNRSLFRILFKVTIILLFSFPSALIIHRASPSPPPCMSSLPNNLVIIRILIPLLLSLNHIIYTIILLINFFDHYNGVKVLRSPAHTDLHPYFFIIELQNLSDRPRKLISFLKHNHLASLFFDLG